jgi:hypothetical protein
MGYRERATRFSTCRWSDKGSERGSGGARSFWEMSELGQKQTSSPALPRVRSTRKSGHGRRAGGRPLRAMSRLIQCSKQHSYSITSSILRSLASVPGIGER